MRKIWIIIIFTAVLGCSSTQERYCMFKDVQFPAKPPDCEIAVFTDELPQGPYEEIARLDVHLEKTHFVSSGLRNALPELKKQARLCGADAIIKIKEKSSQHLETRAYHVTATAIRFTDESNVNQ